MKNRLMTMAGGLAFGAAGLWAQGGGAGAGGGRGFGIGTAPAAAGFQQMGVIGTAGGAVTVPVERSGVANLAGKPFSATAVSKSVQTLSDGTEIETADTDRYYRDNEGRTRVENTRNGRTSITIMDTVGRFTIMLDPDRKTARKMPMAGGRGGAAAGLFLAPTIAVAAARPAAGTVATAAPASEAPLAKPQPTVAPAAEKQAAEYMAQAVTAARGGGGGGRGMAVRTSPNGKVEELGFQTQNGVLAQGTRTTMVIPKGQIGNSRDITVVTERWYSNDIQMFVKTKNSDPRFGVSTYEMSNIELTTPDPTLFQIPLEYATTEIGGGGGARGGVVAPIVK